MVDYNKDMKFVWYTESHDLEIYVPHEEKNEHTGETYEARDFIFYFRSVNELVDLIRTDKKLVNYLKEVL